MTGRAVAVAASVVAAVVLAVGACQAPTAGDDVLVCVERASWQACGAVPPGMAPRAPVADYGAGYP